MDIVVSQSAKFRHLKTFQTGFWLQITTIVLCSEACSFAKFDFKKVVHN